jgi:hypothetical protein
MQHDELVGLNGCLLWGTNLSRRSLAEHLVQRADGPTLALLADTVRSSESWRLRTRCLEVLGLAAAQADQQLGEHILGLLLDRAPGPPQDELSQVVDRPTVDPARVLQRTSSEGGLPR